MKTQFFLLCALATVLSEDIKCYDCDTKNDNQCLYPVENNVKSTLCKDISRHDDPVKGQIDDIDRLDIQPRATNTTPIEYECFSLYFQSDSYEQATGVYRGCAEKTEDFYSSCEYLTERINYGNITKCLSCSTSECNIEYVGAAHSLTVSLGVIILNLILCVKVFSF